MQAAGSTIQLLRFGAFELDIHNNELRRGGVLLKMSPQQLQVLRLLAESAGQLLTREEIQREIWGAETFGDLDRNLNVCVAQIRSALNDDSDAPRFIQTIPKRGYRFVAPVERVTTLGASTPAAFKGSKPSRFWIAVTGIALLAGLVIVGYLVARRPQPSQRIMIAALPFDNLSNDATEGLLTEGLTEELIGQLGSLNPDRLGVIGRNSVLRFKGAPHGIDQIGRDLHVDYVVEGTVRRSAGRIRITARLIKVADQAQVWTETWERAEDETFRIEEEAAAQIVSAVTGKLLGNAALGARPRKTDQEAFQAYLNGRYLQHKENLADLARSVTYFEQAVKIDPQFDEAFSATAETYVALGRSGGKPEDTFPRARQAAEKALRLRDSNEEAHNALANAFFWYEWNWQQAELHFQRAVALNPSFSRAHHDYAFFLVAMGRTEQGLSSLRRAIASDPLSARVNIDAGWLYLQAHRFDDAIRQARRARELEPGLAEANACIFKALMEQRKFSEALALSGQRENADPESALKQSLMLRVQQAEKSGVADTFAMATNYAFLGERTKALDVLYRAYERHSIMMPMLKTEPSLGSLHTEPRFQELARKLALP